MCASCGLRLASSRTVFGVPRNATSDQSVAPECKACPPTACKHKFCAPQRASISQTNLSDSRRFAVTRAPGSDPLLCWPRKGCLGCAAACWVANRWPICRWCCAFTKCKQVPSCGEQQAAARAPGVGSKQGPGLCCCLLGGQPMVNPSAQPCRCNSRGGAYTCVVLPRPGAAPGSAAFRCSS